MQTQVPLIWFYGIDVALFQAILPVYLVAKESAESQFVLALTESQRFVPAGSQVEEHMRRYLIRESRHRLHQPVFASQVMRAYEERYAVCNLNHRELLDAAHIIGDLKPRGEPVVQYGLALCRIHHAAYDRNILGIRPDFTVQIHHRLLDEIDGPMLKYGLQERYGQELMKVPPKRFLWPDTDRLAERFAEFQVA